MTKVSSGDKLSSRERIWISELNVKNYRSIRDAIFRFSPGCNIILGQNSTGKGNILMSLSLGLTDPDPQIYWADQYSPYEGTSVELVLQGVSANLLQDYQPQFAGGTVTLLLTWSKEEVPKQGHTPSGARPAISVRTEQGDVVESSRAHLALAAACGFTNIGPARHYDSNDPLYRELFNQLVSYYLPAEAIKAVGVVTPRAVAMWNEAQALMEQSGIELGLGDKRMIILSGTTEALASGHQIRQMTDELTALLNESGFGIKWLGLDYDTDMVEFLGYKLDTVGKYSTQDMLDHLVFYVEDNRGSFATPKWRRDGQGMIDAPDSTPLVNHGSGLQSLLHIAMIRLLRRKIGGGAIVAVDEPESGLHPHMQRNIVQMLARMADEGQVFVTTHSTDVADLWQQRNLRDRLSIVWRSKVEDRGSWVNSVAEDSPEMSERLSNEDRRTVARYLAVAGSEIFFADGVIIVEGPTEAGLIPAVAQTLGHNLNHRNITVIKAGGKDRMPALLKLCRALGLPHYAVMDFDAVIPKNGKPTYKQLPGLSDKSLTTIGKVASSLKAGHPAGIVPVPSKAELKQINMALSEANCVVWSQDSEHVFTHGIQSPYLPCYEVQDELYGTSAVADWLPHSTPTEQDVLDTLKQSKDEVYWRTMVERWSQSGQTWLNPEIEQVVKAIFGSLSEQRQQLAKAEIPTRASS